MLLKAFFATITFVGLTSLTQALVINEIMSNPIGDDGGREWVELYNETADPVDMSGLTISIKGGTSVAVTPVSGGTVIPPLGYAIIGSVVSGATKFSLEYPSYNGPLLKSSVSLVNTGVTSLDIRLGGSIVSSISSYTAAKEGFSYSLFQNSYSIVQPTPGKENQASASTPSESDTNSTTAISNQVTIAQMSPPSSDIILVLPSEKIVVAGAPTQYSVYAQTTAGKAIDNLTYTWAFGDGGQKTGSSTLYRYFYPGRYIAQVEATNGLVVGVGRMSVRVVAPDIFVSSIQTGKYGSYVTLVNPNTYNLDISEWKLSIDGSIFLFPKNTLLGVGETKFSGVAMGFASTTVTSSTVIKLLFSNMEEIVRTHQQEKDEEVKVTSAEKKEVAKGLTVKPAPTTLKKLIKVAPPPASSMSTTTKKGTSLRQTEKDTRIASWVRTFFLR